MATVRKRSAVHKPRRGDQMLPGEVVQRGTGQALQSESVWASGWRESLCDPWWRGGRWWKVSCVVTRGWGADWFKVSLFDHLWRCVQVLLCDLWCWGCHWWRWVVLWIWYYGRGKGDGERERRGRGWQMVPIMFYKTLRCVLFIKAWLFAVAWVWSFKDQCVSPHNLTPNM